MKTQRSADIAGGFFLVLLGLVTLFAATQIRGGLEERLPPRTLPYVIGSLIIISGAVLAFKSWRFRGEDPRIKWPDRKGVVRIAVTLAGLLLYIALMPVLGLPISTFLYISFGTWYLGRYRITTVLLIGLLTGLISYLLFIYLLQLSFPIGPFIRD